MQKNMPRSTSASRKKTTPFPLLMAIGGGVFLILAAVAAMLMDRSAPASTPAVQDVQSSAPFPGVRRVSLEDAKAALDSRSAIFVDVRGDDVYAMSHIPGAVSIPLDQLETRLSELDREKWIITYCT
jgi:hypothetical protein